MMKKDEIISQLKNEIENAKFARQTANKNDQLAAAKMQLKIFQIKRLKETHQDFLVSANTQKATEFFLKELYGPKDFSQRDHDLERLLPMMEKAFPASALEIITQAMTLDALTERLDNKMAITLGKVFSEQDYMHAFRTQTTKQERQYQLNLVKSVGMSLISFVKIPFIRTVRKTPSFRTGM